ncbi:hypothetical protein MY3296_006465 [Beauveria thailandica]
MDQIEWDVRGGSSDASRAERLEGVYNLVAEVSALQTIPKLSKRQRDNLDLVGRALYNAAGDVWPSFTIVDMLWWLHCGVYLLYGTNSEKGAQMAGVASVRLHAANVFHVHSHRDYIYNQGPNNLANKR